MFQNKKIQAGLAMLLLVVFSFTLVIFFTESPVYLFKSQKKNPNCAALALRDNVIPFQKFGTRLFTYPNLIGSYHEVIYLTEYSKDEKHDAFVSGLRTLLETHDSVDVFLLAHANQYYKWVSEIDSAERKKIRLVYNTGCSGSEQCENWLGLGVQTYVGHKSNESISPVFYFYFLRRWCAGEPAGTAARESNSEMREKLGRLRVPIDSVVLEESTATCFGDLNSRISHE